MVCSIPDMHISGVVCSYHVNGFTADIVYIKYT
jgi:hypothetical protein